MRPGNQCLPQEKISHGLLYSCTGQCYSTSLSKLGADSSFLWFVLASICFKITRLKASKPTWIELFLNKSVPISFFSTSNTFLCGWQLIDQRRKVLDHLCCVFKGLLIWQQQFSLQKSNLFKLLRKNTIAAWNHRLVLLILRLRGDTN